MVPGGWLGVIGVTSQFSPTSLPAVQEEGSPWPPAPGLGRPCHVDYGHSGALKGFCAAREAGEGSAAKRGKKNLPGAAPCWPRSEPQVPQGVFSLPTRCRTVPTAFDEPLPSQAGLVEGPLRRSMHRASPRKRREPTGITSPRPLSPNRGLFRGHRDRAKPPRAAFSCWRAPVCWCDAAFPSRHREKLLSCIKYLGSVSVGGQKERCGSWQCCVCCRGGGDIILPHGTPCLGWGKSSLPLGQGGENQFFGFSKFSTGAAVPRAIPVETAGGFAPGVDPFHPFLSQTCPDPSCKDACSLCTAHAVSPGEDEPGGMCYPSFWLNSPQCDTGQFCHIFTVSR